jgi:hypothetical protein
MAKTKTRATFTLDEESMYAINKLSNFYKWKKTTIVEMALKQFYMERKRTIDAYKEDK